MRQIIPVLGIFKLKLVGICCRMPFKPAWLLALGRVCKDKLSHEDRLWLH